MSKTYLLYYKRGDSKNITVEDYLKMIDSKAREEIANFIGERFKERYIRPFIFDDERYQLDYNNGFAIMACCCLLIETIECHIRGKSSIPKDDAVKYFKAFFERAKNLSYKNALCEFIDVPFYGAIRCGILHQGETKEGYRILRSGKLLNGKKINAFAFLKHLDKYVDSYVLELKSQEWNDEIWVNFRNRMSFTIKQSN